MTARTALVVGSLLMLVAVAAGAFGAHALRNRVDTDLLVVWHIAVQYHAWHAVGLLVVGLLLQRAPGNRAWVAGAWLLIAGIVLFSGSLYALTLTGERWFALITPIGGFSFLAAWAMIAWGAWRSWPERGE